MLFNVASLVREPVGSTRRYALDPEPPVHRGQVELIKMPAAVLVRCRAEVVIDAVCSRCLAPFGYAAQIAFEEMYAQQLDLVAGVRLPAPEEPETFLISLAHTIDITEAVRQYVETAASMQPLCRPDCPGICAECGQDLGLAGCQCSRRTTDSRWAALAALKLTANG